MWRNKMGKKKFENKLLKVLEAEREDNTFEDASDFLHTVYDTADRVRVIAPTSTKMNEFSEALDDILNILMKMKPEQIQALQRIW